MKHKIRLGDSYALTKHKLNQLNIRNFSLLAVLTIMCLYAVKQVSAQMAEPAVTAVADIKPLQIGDTIPEWLWHHPLNVVNHPHAGGNGTITLNDYRGKLIILDFWATWCKPCISSLNKLDTLQRRFADELVVVPTTYEAKEKAGLFIAKKGWALSSAVGDTILKKYFPYQSIPHQVWIKSGRVEAIVGPGYANADQIKDVLEDRKVAFNHKVEVAFDKSKPLFLNGNGGDGSKMLYQSVISGRMNAMVSGEYSPSPNAIIVYNRTVEQLYRRAFSQVAAYTNDRYFIYEIDEDLKNKITPKMISTLQNDSLKREWAQENHYCYNLVLPKQNGCREVCKRMLKDLNEFFACHLNFRATHETRTVKALALVRTEKFQGISTKGGPRVNEWDGEMKALVLENQSLQTLINYLNGVLDLRPKLNLEPYVYPIVDETGITYNVDLHLRAEFTDITSVRNALNKYGIDLIEKVTPVEMIVFSYNQQPN